MIGFTDGTGPGPLSDFTDMLKWYALPMARVPDHWILLLICWNDKLYRWHMSRTAEYSYWYVELIGFTDGTCPDRWVLLLICWNDRLHRWHNSRAAECSHWSVEMITFTDGTGPGPLNALTDLLYAFMWRVMKHSGPGRHCRPQPLYSLERDASVPCTTSLHESHRGDRDLSETCTAWMCITVRAPTVRRPISFLSPSLPRTHTYTHPHTRITLNVVSTLCLNRAT